MERCRRYQQEFDQIDSTLQEVLRLVPAIHLYWKPFDHASFLKVLTIGDLIIHIAQIQEYLFNGISLNFWDHPHEWSSREALPSPALISCYLAEVAEMRARTFAYLDDGALAKQLYLPAGQATTIDELCWRALIHICHHRGQIYAYLHLVTPDRLPPIFPLAPFEENFKRLI